MPRSATHIRATERIIPPVPAGALLNLVTHELFRFEDLRLGEAGNACVYIGASRRCGIVLEDPFVSGTHAAVTCSSPGTFVLVDQASRNGTFEVVCGHARQIYCVDLIVGQRFVLGQTTLMCVTASGHVPLTAFDIGELASLCYDLRASRADVPRPTQGGMYASWLRAMRRGKRG